jgi:uncharacterized protein
LTSIGEQGQLTEELRAEGVGLRDQGRARGSVSAVQAEAADAGDDRPGAGAGAAGGADRGPAEAVGDPAAEAAKFVDAAKEVADVKAALAGARDIIAEKIAEDAELRTLVREACLAEGTVQSSVLADKVGGADEVRVVLRVRGSRWRRSRRIDSWRCGAASRRGCLRVKIGLPAEVLTPRIEAKVGLDPASPFAGELAAAVRDSYVRLLSPGIETDLRIELKMKADRDAVEVFAQNLRTLLLAAPLGRQVGDRRRPGAAQRVQVRGDRRDRRVPRGDHDLPGARARGADARARQELLAFVRKHGPSGDGGGQRDGRTRGGGTGARGAGRSAA